MAANARPQRSLIAALALALALAAAAAWWWQGRSTGVDTAGPQASGANAAAPASSAPRDAQALRAALAQGAHQGIKPFGNWCVTPEAGLQPCPGLRDRLEYYLLALGEATPEELRALVAEDARLTHGAALADEILVIFDRYLAVRSYSYQHPLDFTKTEAWQAALTERQQVRRQGLGQAWAEAFFGEEERNALADLARQKSGQPPVMSNKSDPRLTKEGRTAQALRAERVQRFGVEEADRLERIDARQVRVNAAINETRQEWLRLTADNTLSGPERAAQIKRFVAQRLSDPEEQDMAMQFARMPPR